MQECSETQRGKVYLQSKKGSGWEASREPDYCLVQLRDCQGEGAGRVVLRPM